MTIQNEAMEGNQFLYTDDFIDSFEEHLSAPRFARYVQATHGDRPSAARLYTWNTAISAAFYGPLQSCEVGLRNAVHSVMREDFGDHWYESPDILRSSERDLARQAVNRLERRHVIPDCDRVVAELTLGYWVGLFANAYDQSLWRSHLHRLMRPRPKRPKLFDDLDHLRTLRNRIAHHEPLLRRDLADDHDRVHRVLIGLSPHVHDWAGHHDRILGLLGTEPEHLEQF